MEFLAFDFGHAAAFPEKAGDELGRGLSAKESRDFRRAERRQAKHCGG
jgi:hypothetical protein